MIVVSDTSILSGLIQIGRLQLLQQVYGTIIIPVKVQQELLRLADYAVSLDSFTGATWIQTRVIKNRELVSKLALELDAGEAEALVLALEVQADLILIDELRGRGKAYELGIPFTGLLGTLKVAKTKGFIAELKPIIADLQVKAGVWYNAALIERVLQDVNEG